MGLFIQLLFIQAFVSASSEPFAPYKGTFVLLNGTTNKVTVLSEKLSKTPLAPCSTFKIPNTVFALEAGVAKDSTYAIPYDPKTNPPQKWWPDKWDRDHSLKSAFANSVVWFYQSVAKKIDSQRMKSFLEKANYGNQDISGGIDQFWLSSSLKISPIDQVYFLKNLFEGKLPFKKSSIDVLRDISIEESTKNFTLRGKTGTCRLKQGGFGAWWIGAVTKKDNTPYYFAIYIEGEDFSGVNKDRKNIGRKLLKKNGVL